MSQDYYEDTLNAIANNWEKLKEVNPSHPLLRFIDEVTPQHIKFNKKEYFNGFVTPHMNNMEHGVNKMEISMWGIDISYQLALKKAIDGKYEEPKLKIDVRTPFSSTWKEADDFSGMFGPVEGGFNLPSVGFLGPDRKDWNHYHSVREYFTKNSSDPFLEGRCMFEYLVNKGIVRHGSKIEVVEGKKYIVGSHIDKEPLRERGNLRNKSGLTILTFSSAPKGWILKGSILDKDIQKLPNY